MIGPDGAAELAIARGGDGHFHLDAEANGVAVRFLVDTGASDTVLTLARRGAQRHRPGRARSSTGPWRPRTAPATSPAATLESLEIGPYRLSDVPVGVMPEGALDTEPPRHEHDQPLRRLAGRGRPHGARALTPASCRPCEPLSRDGGERAADDLRSGAGPRWPPPSGSAASAARPDGPGTARSCGASPRRGARPTRSGRSA